MLKVGLHMHKPASNVSKYQLICATDLVQALWAKGKEEQFWQIWDEVQRVRRQKVGHKVLTGENWKGPSRFRERVFRILLLILLHLP